MNKEEADYIKFQNGEKIETFKGIAYWINAFGGEMPLSEPEQQITEDAEFEIIEPKQIENGKEF